MIVELCAVLAVLVGGCALLRPLGITGWPLPALGFLAGTALQLTIGLIQVATPLPTSPVLTLALTAGAPLAWWLMRLVQGRDVGVPLVPAVHCLLTVTLAVAVLRVANLVNWHTDSFRYLIVGRLIADGDYHHTATADLLTKRLLAVPLIHAPANLTDDSYLRSAVPLLAVATVAALAWFFREGTRGKLSPTTIAVFALLTVGLLASMNRFVFHAFYLNGHLLFAALLLMIAGAGWLLVSGSQVPPRALVAIQLLAVPALVITRAEGSLVALLALLPTLVAAQVPIRSRQLLLGVTGSAILLWQAYVALALSRLGIDGRFPVYAELALGVLVLAAVPLLRWSVVQSHGRYARWLAEGGLWLGLIAFTVRDPHVLRDSLRATTENVVLGAGSWGLSLVLLAGVVAVALVLFRAPALEPLRFPLLTFVPLAFLLAYLREGAYRVGNGDSLNRMLMQVVPLAVLYAVLALTTGRRRGARRRPAPAGPQPANTPTVSQSTSDPSASGGAGRVMPVKS